MNKEQIDEITLRVAYEVEEIGSPPKYTNEFLCKFTHALLAELEKVIEPVAVVVDDPNSPGWTKVRMIKAMCNDTKLFTHPLPQPDLVAEIEEAKAALGDYVCSDDDLASAIRRLVSSYKERNQTAANFMSELNATDHRLESYIKEADKLRQQLSAAQSRIELLEHDAKTGDYETLYAQTVVELSVSQASESELLNTLEVAADQIRKCDYTPARSTLLQAIADHKARKDGNESTICKTRHA